MAFWAIAFAGSCPAKGRCGAPIEPMLVFIVLHWLVVGFVIKKNLTVAKWMMVFTGVVPFFSMGFVYYYSSEDMYQYLNIYSVYLFVFGLVYTAYLFFSREVREYERNKNT